MNEVQIFKALGDPIRLKIVKRLSQNPELNISTVSYELGITRQGVRKHLQVLINAHMVIPKAKGRDTIVHLNPHALERAKKCIALLGKQWEDRLNSLKNFVEEI